MSLPFIILLVWVAVIVVGACVVLINDMDDPDGSSPPLWVKILMVPLLIPVVLVIYAILFGLMGVAPPLR